MTNLEISEEEYANFVRIDEELRELATRIFEEQSKTFNPQLRYEIRNIEFDESGCTIWYYSTHCSNCRDEVDTLFVTLDELLNKEI